jgi:hypothetical protein
MIEIFKAFVEMGYQYLQSPGGQKIWYLTFTQIKQGVSHTKGADCEFWLNVNYEVSNVDEFQQPCKYNPESGQLSMPNGEILPVEVIEYTPGTMQKVPHLKVKCKVEFPYDTKHND